VPFIHFWPAEQDGLWRNTEKAVPPYLFLWKTICFYFCFITVYNHYSRARVQQQPLNDCSRSFQTFVFTRVKKKKKLFDFLLYFYRRNKVEISIIYYLFLSVVRSLWIYFILYTYKSRVYSVDITLSKLFCNRNNNNCSPTKLYLHFSIPS